MTFTRGDVVWTWFPDYPAESQVVIVLHQEHSHEEGYIYLVLVGSRKQRLSHRWLHHNPNDAQVQADEWNEDNGRFLARKALPKR